MKNYIKIGAICVLGLFINACTEEKILDLSPINRISLDQAFSSPSLIESSMNGVYNAAAVGQYNTTNPNGGRGYLWGAAFIQQGDCRGEDVINTATFYEFTYTATYDATTPNNVFYWVEGYRLINRCNLMIEGVNTAVSKGIITQSVANNYIGQAQFLRAITHFELLTHFSNPYNFTVNATHQGIPYREVGVDSESEVTAETTKSRNTVAECYSKVLADLNSAEALITNTNFFKATKNAAIAFKTRVNLHKRDWASVISEGLKLSSLSVTASPNTPFTIPSAPNSESIFSIQQGATAGQNAGVNGALASQYKRRLLVCISPIIWRDPLWLATDKRREEGVMVVTQSGRKYTNKYKDDVNYTDAAPIIRYAEVLLNMAEAYARLPVPNLTAALTNLNLVRNRSLANPTTEAYTAASFTTDANMVGAILTERRIEFVMEGRRWSDIHRLQGDNLRPIVGIPAKYGNGNPLASDFVLGTPYTGPRTVATINDFRFLWPIPQIEIVNNPTLAAQQNPGW